MAYQLLNNYSALLTAYLTSSATQLPVSAAKASELASLLGSNHTTLVINDGTVAEVVEVRCQEGTIVTIVRGREGTQARAFSVGTCAKAQLTAAGLSYLICNSGCACVPIDMKAGLVIEQPTINIPWTHSWYFTGTYPFTATGITGFGTAGATPGSPLTLDVSQLATGLLTVYGTFTSANPLIFPISIVVTGCGGSSEVITEKLIICSPTGLGS